MFSLKSKKIKLVPSMKGDVVELNEVPDAVFSSKMIGDGYAIIPHEGTVVSPIDGIVSQIFPTHHAIGIISETGLEILVHIGIDTVELKGEGFKRLVAVDQHVKAGTPLIEVDLNVLKGHGKSCITPVVITNMELVKTLTVITGRGKAYAAEIVLKR